MRDQHDGGAEFRSRSCFQQAQGSAPAPSRPAPSSARPQSATPDRSSAPSRSSRAAASRRITDAGSAWYASSGEPGMPMRRQQFDRPRGRRAAARETVRCARICSTICHPIVNAPGSSHSWDPGRSWQSLAPRTAAQRTLAPARSAPVPPNSTEPDTMAFGSPINPERRQHGNRLAGAGFPHQADNLAGIYIKGDVVHNARTTPARHAEVDA